MKYHVSFDIELKKNPYKGKYIAIEGIDGSGKSSQVELLIKKLKKEGYDVVSTRESKHTDKLGQLIADILHENVDASVVTLQHIYVARRADTYKNIIEPALKAGKIVVSDRTVWSSIPYGLSDVLSEKEIANDTKLSLAAYSILSLYHQFIVPDVTFFVEVPVKDAVKRLKGAGKALDRYENAKKLEIVIKIYDFLLKKFPKVFVKVDGSKSIDAVAEEIYKKVASSL